MCALREKLCWNVNKMMLEQTKSYGWNFFTFTGGTSYTLALQCFKFMHFKCFLIKRNGRRSTKICGTNDFKYIFCVDSRDHTNIFVLHFYGWTTAILYVLLYVVCMIFLFEFFSTKIAMLSTHSKRFFHAWKLLSLPEEYTCQRTTWFVLLK